MSRILLTGGSGRLGQALQALRPGVLAPASAELDITNREQVLRQLEAFAPEIIVHAAAFTDVTRAESEKELCWQVNVLGTRHVAQAAREIGAKLILISTDYVFDGQHGNYAEDDPPGIPTTYYGLTKLVAEEAAQQANNPLIVRTSFRPSPFPYPAAADDLFTGQDYLDIIAPHLALLLDHADEIEEETLHVVTERKSVYELAHRRSPSVRRISRSELAPWLPADVSLNASRWQELSRDWEQTPFRANTES